MNASIKMPVVAAWLVTAAALAGALAAAGAFGAPAAHETYEPADPRANGAATRAAMEKEWRAMPPGAGAGLHVAVGSIDQRYERETPPPGAALGAAGSITNATQPAWSGVAWRGERVNAQLVAWSAQAVEQLHVTTGPLHSDAGGEIPAAAVHAFFVRYVLAGKEPATHLVADVLDDAARLDLPARSTRPIWLSIDVPADAKPGVYRGAVTVTAKDTAEQHVELSLEVLPALLPPPAQWKIHLDLWQNPWAIARYHHVRPWSDEHFALLAPHLRMLADAGEKCITATIVDRPWGDQTTYDPFGSMVQWTKKRDGTWSFDCANFDRYVALAKRCGLPGPIDCYSMVTWSNRYAYFDEASGRDVIVTAMPGTPEYAAHWRPFLAAFVGHLKAMHLFEETQVAMDERGPEQMTPLLDFVHNAAPGLRIKLAGYNHPEVGRQIDDWSVLLWKQNDAEKRYLDPAVLAERAKNLSLRTTFYVCTQPRKPNTFTDSPPAEAEWLGWYAAAKGYDGILRWAAFSWTQDPLVDTTWTKWPPGDCFLIYPGPHSSIRFERFRDGIEAFEKVRMVRAALMLRSDTKAHDALTALDGALAKLSFEAVQKADAAEELAPCREVLEQAARLLP